MASAFPYFIIFSFCLLLSSGASVAVTPMEAIQETLVGNQENQILYSSPVSTTQLDTVPIINPTTPGTTPTVNPIESPPATPFGESPPATPFGESPPSVPFGESPPAPLGFSSPPAPTGVTTFPPVTNFPPVTTNPPASTTPTSSGSGSWCIASPTASQTALQVALDYACGYGGADCSALQSGASCYEPNTVRDHASYAFNSYYQKNAAPTSCVFGGTGQLTSTDPSHGSCRFASSPTTTPSITPPVNQTPTVTSPSTMTPTITTPGGPTVFGVPEPTGQPSSATSVTCGVVLLFAATGIVWPLLAANHL